MIQALVAFFTALPGLVKLIWELLALFKNYKDKQLVKETEEALRMLRESKTPEEKQNAAKAISGIISKL